MDCVFVCLIYANSLFTALPTLSSNLRPMPRRCWRRLRDLTFREGPSLSTLSERKAKKGARVPVSSAPSQWLRANQPSIGSEVRTIAFSNPICLFVATAFGQANKTLVVNNLAFSATEEVLQSTFEKAVSIRIPQRDGRPKG